MTTELPTIACNEYDVIKNHQQETDSESNNNRFAGETIHPVANLVDSININTTTQNENIIPVTPSQTNDTCITKDHSIHSVNISNIRTKPVKVSANSNNIDNDSNNNTPTYIQNKAIQVPFFNRYIVTRIWMLILSILLIIICVLNAFGQMNTLYLKEFICPNKELNEIYAHSREYNLTGGTSSGCWQSKGVNINDDVLFSANNQPFGVKSAAHTPHNIMKSIIFAIFAFILFLSFCYFHVFSLIRDIVRYKNLYYARNHSNKTSSAGNTTKNSRKCCKKYEQLKETKCCERYKSICGEDHCLWLVKLIMSEIIEITIQTLALLKYNGVYLTFNSNNFSFHVNDQDNISLSEKRELITFYAFIIGLNCIVTGAVWMLYPMKNKKYHGLTFKYLLFLADSTFDFGYAMFPLIIVVWNNYNANRPFVETMTLAAASLQYNSWITFLSSFFPIIALCYRLCWSISNIVYVSQKHWIKLYKTKQVARLEEYQLSYTYSNSDQDEKFNDMDESSFALNVMLHTNVGEYINNGCCCAFIWNGQKVLDDKFNLDRLRRKRVHVENFDDEGVIQLAVTKYKQQQMLRRCCMVIFAMIFIIFGLIFITLNLVHFHKAEKMCNNQDLFQTHSELRVWQKSCLYKVYPFTFDAQEIPCQCRILSIDLVENESEYNFSENTTVFNDVFLNFYMLEAIKIRGNADNLMRIDFGLGNSKEMYSAQRLRVFDVENMAIRNMNDGIINWSSHLEYFRMAYCQQSGFPSQSAMRALTKLKYINLEYDVLSEMSLDFVCSMKQLEYFIINGNSFFAPYPSCIYTDLNQLKEIDISLSEGGFNYKMLNLPNLHQLIAFGTSHSLFPINESFEYNKNAIFYFSGSVFCNQIQNLSIYVQTFLNQTDACRIICPGLKGISEYVVCRPLFHGNGVCNTECNIPQCNYDAGDCNQLCDITNCLESECNESCNTTQCAWDFGACIDNDYMYAAHNYTLCETQTGCEYHWIGDKICDDACNVDVCGFDAGDCDECSDRNAPYCTSAWTFFSTFAGSNNVWDENEICDSWDTLMSWPDHPVQGYNCSQMISMVDLDNTRYLNGYESMLAYLGFFQNDRSSKTFQVNCSLCGPDVDTYYYPWHSQHIQYYTQNAENIAFKPLKL